MFGPMRLIQHHAWRGVAAAPEICSRLMRNASEGIPAGPFGTPYCTPPSGRAGEPSAAIEVASGVALGAILAALL